MTINDIIKNHTPLDSSADSPVFYFYLHEIFCRNFDSYSIDTFLPYLSLGELESFRYELSGDILKDEQPSGYVDNLFRLYLTRKKNDEGRDLNENDVLSCNIKKNQLIALVNGQIQAIEMKMGSPDYTISLGTFRSLPKIQMMRLLKWDSPLRTPKYLAGVLSVMPPQEWQLFLEEIGVFHQFDRVFQDGGPKACLDFFAIVPRKYWNNLLAIPNVSKHITAIIVIQSRIWDVMCDSYKELKYDSPGSLSDLLPRVDRLSDMLFSYPRLLAFEMVMTLPPLHACFPQVMTRLIMLELILSMFEQSRAAEIFLHPQIQKIYGQLIEKEEGLRDFFHSASAHLNLDQHMQLLSHPAVFQRILLSLDQKQTQFIECMPGNVLDRFFSIPEVSSRLPAAIPDLKFILRIFHLLKLENHQNLISGEHWLALLDKADQEQPGQWKNELVDYDVLTKLENSNPFKVSIPAEQAKILLEAMREGYKQLDERQNNPPAHYQRLDSFQPTPVKVRPILTWLEEKAKVPNTLTPV